MPFRADKPEWLMTLKTLDGKPAPIKRVKAANCFANEPFFDWLSRVNDDGLATGYYQAWCMDGSFFGDGGWYTTVIPVDCTSDRHDHLPGDSNYACQRALDRLIAGEFALSAENLGLKGRRQVSHQPGIPRL